MKRLLFVCVQNCCRSQMAEGFARHLGGDDIEAWSAGSDPAGHVNEQAVRLMAERGIDISGQTSTGVEALPEGPFDVCVSMCGDRCPTVGARERLDWDVSDPHGLPDGEFEKVRDEIEHRVRQLLARI